MAVVALRRKDGTREFDCQDCGIHTFQAASYDPGEDCLCATCEWIEAQPNLTAAEREQIRAIVNR